MKIQHKTIIIARVKCSLDDHGHLVLEMPHAMTSGQFARWKQFYKASAINQLSIKNAKP